LNDFMLDYLALHICELYGVDLQTDMQQMILMNMCVIMWFFLVGFLAEVKANLV
jgi:hypothetical protein